MQFTEILTQDFMNMLRITILIIFAICFLQKSKLTKSNKLVIPQSRFAILLGGEVALFNGKSRRKEQPRKNILVISWRVSGWSVGRAHNVAKYSARVSASGENIT